MFKFENSLTESDWTVAGTKSDKILIFDIDDTLIHSNATTDVYNNGELIAQLSPAEFNRYKLKDGEQFDFRNFDNSKILNNSEFTTYWTTLKREYFKGTHIAILTARSRPVMIKKFFLKNGIDIKDELIFCCGYSKFPYKGTVQYKKSKIIEKLISMGYKTFVFFDDNENNLKTAKLIENQYSNIRVITVHVKE